MLRVILDYTAPVGIDLHGLDYLAASTLHPVHPSRLSPQKYQGHVSSANSVASPARQRCPSSIPGFSKIEADIYSSLQCDIPLRSEEQKSRSRRVEDVELKRGEPVFDIFGGEWR
jgi:hypothetical protein